MTTIDPRHLLVVEDDEDIRTLIAKYLVDHGFTVTLAGSGGEMDKILATEKVDLVVLDVNLPGEDGFSICLRLRNVNRLPVVMVTSRGEDMPMIISSSHSFHANCSRASAPFSGEARRSKRPRKRLRSIALRGSSSNCLHADCRDRVAPG